MKKLSFIILSLLFASLLVFSVSADDPSAYVIDGEKTVFLSNDASVSYKGETYIPFSSLAQAFQALGADGGKAIVCGSFSPSDNVNDSDFIDPAGRGPVTITGASGADTDSLNQSATLDFKSGRIIFDDITLKMMKTKYFSAPDLVMTENFKVSKSGGSLFMTGMISGNTNRITQVISGGIFDQMNIIGMWQATLGSTSAPGYASITINGGTVNTQINFGSGYSDSTVYGNLYYIINGGDFTTKKIVESKLIHASGKKVVIFNNGMADGFEVIDSAYIIRSSAGGTVSIDENSASDENPVLIFTPEEGKIPAANGIAIFAGADGKYSLPLDSTKQYDITWVEEISGGCIIDGVKTVFLSNDENVIYNGISFTPFTSLGEAFAALGAEGGKAIICGDFSPSDNNTDSDFVDPAGRGPVTITGIAGADTDSLSQYSLLNFKSGKIILDDITLKVKKLNYISAPDLVITEKFKVQNDGGDLFLTGLISGNTNKVTQTISGGIFHQINLIGVNSATLGSEPAPGYASVTINGGDINTHLNGGSGYSNVNVYGNLYFIINGGNFSNKNITYNNLTHASGRKIVIFNNGTAEGFNIDSDSVFVVKSSEGGSVLVDESSAANAEPILVFSPEAEKVPCVNGEELSLGDDGRYTLKVSENGVYTVSWSERTAAVYEIDGVKTVFVSDINADVEYNGEKYIPFTSLTEAVSNLKDGGTVIIGRTYTHIEFSDTIPRGTITVKGADDDSVLKISGDAQPFTFNGGPTVMDDITVFVETSNGKYIHGNGNIIFTKNFSSNSNLYISPIYSTNEPKSEIIVENGQFAVIDVISSNAQVGTEENPSHTSAHLNGGSFYSVNGGWGWAPKTMYGNLFIYVNGSYISGGVTFSDQGTITGKKTVIFNNEMYKRPDGSEISVDPAYDFVVYSKKGGFVSVEDEDTTGNPVFILTPEGSGIPYIGGKPVQMTDGVYRYAPESSSEKINVEWRKNYTITFDPNGASGEVPQPITNISGETYQLPDASGLTKENCIFIGWNTDPDADSGFTFLTLTEDIQLYAIWLEKLPTLYGTPNFDANGVVRVEINHVPITDGSISDSISSAQNDPVFISSSAAVYAFEINAYGSDGNIRGFENGIDFIIPDYAYPSDSNPGEFLRLYRADGLSAEFICNLDMEDGGMRFSAYESGKYFLMLNTPDTAEYIYTVSQSENNVKVNVYFRGAAAQSGFFGIKYNSGLLNLESFDYAEGFYSAGNIPKEQGGYDCYVNEQGLFGDAWAAKTFADAQNSYVLLGCFNFTASDNAGYDDFAFSAPSPDEYGASDHKGFPAGADSAYLPYYESCECFYQPALYMISDNIAFIEGNGYPSLDSAFTVAQTGNTVYLLGEAVVSPGLVVPGGCVLEICKGASISGEKLLLSQDSVVISYESIYDSLHADTLVAVRSEGVKHIYKPSGIASEIVTLDGVQIRLSGVQGLRFIAKISAELENNSFSDYGIIVIPYDLSEGGNTTHETAQCGDISMSLLGDEFKYFEITDNSFSYTVCITEIAVKNYIRDFTARPYIKYVSDDGEYTVYADYNADYNLSVIDVANGLIAEGSEDSEELQKIIDEYEEYTAQQ